jgi:hypothetical protein
MRNELCHRLSQINSGTGTLWEYQLDAQNEDYAGYFQWY